MTANRTTVNSLGFLPQGSALVVPLYSLMRADGKDGLIVQVSHLTYCTLTVVYTHFGRRAFE